MKQFKLFKEIVNLCFGGTTLKGKRKVARPLDSKRPIHLILKATNPFLLLRNRQLIGNVLSYFNEKFGVKVYEYAIQADHIHLCAKIPNRPLYRAWIRAVTSTLVRKIPGLKWNLRPYSKIASWGRQFKILIEYIKDNHRCGEFVVNAHSAGEEYWSRAFAEFQSTA
jgi:REP element-mobilizing transposase RayT